MTNVRVYWVEPRRLGADRERIDRWLNPDERAKHARFATSELRDEYLVTRALARFALSRERPGVPPEAWTFDRTNAGKPFVVGPDRSALFNLSNQPGLVACAVTSEGALVGVDVEDCAGGDSLLTSADRLFAPTENATLAKLPREEAAVRATTLWALKEACLKAWGEGIAFKLPRLAIEQGSSGREEVVSAPEFLEKYRVDFHHEVVATPAARYVVAAALLREARARHVLEPPSMRLIEVSWLLVP